MHHPLLIASLAGSVLGIALPEHGIRDVSPDTTDVVTPQAAGTTHVIDTSTPCEDEDTTLTPYATPTDSPAGDTSPKSSSVPEITSAAVLPEPSDTPEVSANSGEALISYASSSITDTSAWPTMLPAVPGNQPTAGLDCLAPTNSSTFTFTMDGSSDPSTEHLFAEMTANHSIPAVVLEHSQLVFNIDCTPQGLQVDFWTPSAVDYVRSAWDMSFIAIVWSADCGSAPTGHHSYWNVTKVTYPDGLTARLDATEVAVEDALDQVHLIWGTHVPEDTTVAAAASDSSDGESSSDCDSSPDDDTDDCDIDTDVDQDDDQDYDGDEGYSTNDDSGSDEDDTDASDDDGSDGSDVDVYLDFDEDFSSALQSFAPGLSTYSLDDFDDDDSPANATVGDPDYDIEDSGILRLVKRQKKTAADTKAAQAKQQADAKAAQAKKDADAKAAQAKQQADAKAALAKQQADAKAKQEADAKVAQAAKAKQEADAKAAQAAKAKQEADAKAAQAKQQADAKAAQAAQAKQQADTKPAPAKADTKVTDLKAAEAKQQADNKAAQAKQQEDTKAIQAAQAKQPTDPKAVQAAQAKQQADNTAAQAKQLADAKAVQAAQAKQQTAENNKAVKENNKVAAKNKATINRQNSAQLLETAKNDARTLDKAKSESKAVAEKSKTEAKTVRDDYLNAEQAAKANPGNKALADKAKAARQKLNEANAKATKDQDDLLAKAKSAKEAERKVAAAEAVKNAKGSNGLPTGQGKNSKANSLAIAKVVTQDSLAKLKKGSSFLSNALSKAKDIFKVVKEGYNLVKDAVEVVTGLSSVKPDTTFEVNYEVNKKKPEKLADSLWGDQYQIIDDEKSNDAGTATAKYSLYCVDCGVTATIHIAGEVKFDVLARKLDAGSIVVDGSNLAAKLFLGLQVNAEASKEKSYNIFSTAIPPGFSIPSIITIGPAVRLDARLNMNLEAEGTLLAGAEASFSDFKATLNLLDPKNTGFEGFKPTFTPKFEASGAIQASARLGFPLSVGIGIQIPLANYDNGISLANEPFINGVASYGKAKGCDKGVDYSIGAGNNIYADLLKITTTTLYTYRAPALTTGCYPIPSAVAKFLPPGPARPKPDDSSDTSALGSLIDEAKTASTKDSSSANPEDHLLTYSTVTAGSGAWFLSADADGLLTLVTADKATDATLSQRSFAYIDGAVSADSTKRLLAFSRATMDDARWGFSALRVLADDRVTAGDEAVTLAPVEAAEDGASVLVPLDTKGESYFTWACQVRGRINKVFIVKSSDQKKVRTVLESGEASKAVFNGEFMKFCQPVAFDAPKDKGITADADIPAAR